MLDLTVQQARKLTQPMLVWLVELEQAYRRGRELVELPCGQLPQRVYETRLRWMKELSALRLGEFFREGCGRYRFVPAGLPGVKRGAVAFVGRLRADGVLAGYPDWGAAEYQRLAARFGAAPSFEDALWRLLASAADAGVPRKRLTGWLTAALEREFPPGGAGVRPGPGGGGGGSREIDPRVQAAKEKAELQARINRRLGL
jgi:hypothetical protein